MIPKQSIATMFHHHCTERVKPYTELYRFLLTIESISICFQQIRNRLSWFSNADSIKQESLRLSLIHTDFYSYLQIKKVPDHKSTRFTWLDTTCCLTDAKFLKISLSTKFCNRNLLLRYGHVQTKQENHSATSILTETSFIPLKIKDFIPYRFFIVK